MERSLNTKLVFYLASGSFLGIPDTDPRCHLFTQEFLEVSGSISRAERGVLPLADVVRDPSIVGQIVGNVFLLLTVIFRKGFRSQFLCPTAL